METGDSSSPTDSNNRSPASESNKMDHAGAVYVPTQADKRNSEELSDALMKTFAMTNPHAQDHDYEYKSPFGDKYTGTRPKDTLVPDGNRQNDQAEHNSTTNDVTKNQTFDNNISSGNVYKRRLSDNNSIHANDFHSNDNYKHSNNQASLNRLSGLRANNSIRRDRQPDYTHKYKDYHSFTSLTRSNQGKQINSLETRVRELKTAVIACNNYLRSMQAMASLDPSNREIREDMTAAEMELQELDYLIELHYDKIESIQQLKAQFNPDLEMPVCSRINRAIDTNELVKVIKYKERDDPQTAFRVMYRKLLEYGKAKMFSAENYKTALSMILDGDIFMLYSEMQHLPLEEIIKTFKDLYMKDDVMTTYLSQLDSFQRKPNETLPSVMTRYKLLLIKTSQLYSSEQRAARQELELIKCIKTVASSAAKCEMNKSITNSQAHGEMLSYDELYRIAVNAERHIVTSPNAVINHIPIDKKGDMLNELCNNNADTIAAVQAILRPSRFDPVANRRSGIRDSSESRQRADRSDQHMSRRNVSFEDQQPDSSKARPATPIAPRHRSSTPEWNRDRNATFHRSRPQSRSPSHQRSFSTWSNNRPYDRSISRERSDRPPRDAYHHYQQTSYGSRYDNPTSYQSQGHDSRSRYGQYRSHYDTPGQHNALHDNRMHRTKSPTAYIQEDPNGTYFMESSIHPERLYKVSMAYEPRRQSRQQSRSQSRDRRCSNCNQNDRHPWGRNCNRKQSTSRPQSRSTTPNRTCYACGSSTPHTFGVDCPKYPN